MKRIAINVGVIVLVFGSLITFPAHLHWMASIWLVLSLIAKAFKKPMWPWLAGCVLIIAIKRPGYTAEFWILSILFFVVAFFDWREIRRKPETVDRKRLAIFALVLIAATTSYGITRRFASNTFVN